MSRLKEQRAWDNFKTSIATERLKLKRVENLVDDGTPDVIGQNRRGTVFWVENKALDAWPKRASTFPLRDAFEPGQLPFLRNWVQWNGHAFVLLRVGTDYYLLDPLQELRELTQEGLMQACVMMGKPQIIAHLEAL